MNDQTGYSETTQVIHGGQARGRLVRTPVPPVQRGSTILMGSAYGIYDGAQATYGRGGLATQQALREALSDLEHADHTALFPSGLSAITQTLLALTAAGDEVLVADCAYNPTRKFLNGAMRRFGVSARYFDPAADASRIEAMMTPRTRAIYLESPGSLTFDMQDIPAIAAMARRRGVLTVVDNTWAAGVLFKPLDHGVDVSIQSLTKYVCGHSDVFMGSASARGEAAARLAEAACEFGWAVSPDDAYMALRGLKTLHGRLAQHGAGAQIVGDWLADQPQVLSVLSPARADHPGHGLWRRDFSGACGLLGIVLRPASDAAVCAMLEALEVFGLGLSWGGFESLAIPCDPQLGQRAHAPDLGGPLLRLHIGLESPQDLIADLDRGLGRLDQDLGIAQLRRASS